MRTQTVEKTEAWWINNINLLHLAPQEDGTILGDVNGQGGWCNVGAWESPITDPARGIYPEAVSGTAQEFADGLAVILGVSSADVVSAIGRVLEQFKDKKDGA
jgi:hypothetical protein